MPKGGASFLQHHGRELDLTAEQSRSVELDLRPWRDCLGSAGEMCKLCLILRQLCQVAIVGYQTAEVLPMPLVGKELYPDEIL